MTLAALLFAFSNVIVKFISAAFSSGQIAFVRFLIGGVILWPVLRAQKVPIKGNGTLLLICRGFFGTISYFCLLKSISLIPLSNAIVLFYTYPLFVVLFTFLLFKVMIGRKELIFMCLGVIGIYLLVKPDFHTIVPGHVFALLGGCLGGLAVSLISKARQTNGPWIIYFYFCLLGVIMLAPSLYGFSWPNAGDGMILGLIGLFMLFAQVLMNQGFKFCKASEGALLLNAEAVFTGIASILIFSDPMTWNFLTGAVLIIGSGIGINLINRKVRTTLTVSTRNTAS
jgi:drug/metabolite transporter (DMT)-like permease